MSKRSVTEVHASSNIHGESRKTPRSESKQKEQAVDDEMGEFEDGWEDEYESDEEIVDAESGKAEDGMQTHLSYTGQFLTDFGFQVWT